VAGEGPTNDRRLTRSRDDRLLGGVAGGLGEFLGVDPTLVRIVFVLVALFGGSGLVLYVALWLLVPPADDGERAVEDNVRGAAGEMRESIRGLAVALRSGWRGEPPATGG
jgi:phage shock protein C